MSTFFKIVGSPMAELLKWANATVTICHIYTRNIETICQSADIIVCAVGKANLVKPSWVKPGAVVIDCGINAIPDPNLKSGANLINYKFQYSLIFLSFILKLLP